MATDPRGHTVPAGDEPPARSAILDLSLSIRDPKPVANTTARAQHISDLAGAGITPSTSNPVFVFRADAPAGAQLEYTTDASGTTWHTVPATPLTAMRMAAGTASGSMASQATITISDTFPASRFTVAPIVTPVIIGASGYVSTLRVGVSSTSTSGVTFVVNSVTGASITGSITVNWIAVQMTASTAAG